LSEVITGKSCINIDLLRAKDPIPSAPQEKKLQIILEGAGFEAASG
jgi:hypothetical protein